MFLYMVDYDKVAFVRQLENLASFEPQLDEVEDYDVSLFL